jgi:hypothetical protein
MKCLGAAPFKKSDWHGGTHEEHIKEQKKKVSELRAKAERGIENVRLHEQTHFNIDAMTAD